MKQQLPGHHFMLTFTVPEPLRRFIRKNQRVAYSALFKTSSEAIKKLAPDEKYIGGDLPGFLNSQAVGSSEASLKYLAPYVFKVAISNSRILKVENNTVFFRYTKPHSRRVRTMALNAMEFIRRFLQHVLPTGFMKIRYYGFLNSNCSVPLKKISALIQMAYAFSWEIPEYPESPSKTPTCPLCGGILRYIVSFIPIPLDSS